MVCAGETQRRRVGASGIAMAPVAAVLLVLCVCNALAAMDSCYEPGTGAAQICMPEFCNAAFGRTLLATHVCGSPHPEEYCLQTGVTGVTKSCHVCDAQDPERNHNASFLNDFHSEEEPTWWQSPSMLHGVQFPNSVNLTLHLGKSFEITYVRLKFHTSRPESFAIYKRTHEDAPWTPYQYYSASCQRTYNHSTGTFLRAGDEERVPFCTDEFSDMSPLTGGNVAFSTLEGRPSAYSFDSSPVLQDWVTATDLLISLKRLNTFGDDIFRDHRVLRSYYYSISDFSVGGRCKCNGHASECVTNQQGRLVCDCQHHTAGVDCERCQPFYHDRPWARGSSEAANECLPCNCSGRSEQCSFSVDLYRRTGHGGQCQNCRGDTAGPHCEACKENFYRRNAAEVCESCNCSAVGSLSLQCDHNGDCVCKATVAGKKCDQCQKGYHSLSEGGCRKCGCWPEGSIGDCDSANGECTCKRNVEGALCHRCKSGTFNLQAHNPHGCSSCFCYGHSTACTSASQFTVHRIVSTFQQDTDGWQRQSMDGGESPLSWEKGRISLFPEAGEWEYFVAPAKFLANQLLSYSQNLSFTLHVESEELPSLALILEGSGIHVSASVSPEMQNKTSLSREWAVNFTLHEAGIQGETVSSFQFQQLLSSLTAVKLGSNGTVPVHLTGVNLVTAQADLSSRAAWVEECLCPEGYVGQFCESCAPGYKREVPFGGPFNPCVSCACNQHGSCEPDSGICECVHNTVGPSCEYCASGYYGNPFRGWYNDCEPCPCPARSNCTLVEERNEVVCTDCPNGQTGKRCEMCDDGFYGDPLGLRQFVRPCARCQCNGNSDPNAVGNCDPLTGRCLKCLFHTVGHYCDRCEDGFYGNALAPSPADKCRPCACSPIGSTNQLQTCDSGSGQCECLPHVIGRDCSQCEPGYYNLQPTVGCLSCACHPLGSRNAFCQSRTGQCNCRPGIEGRSCDQCQRGYFDLSERGCQACDCSPLGSVGMQCLGNGSCVCKTGFVGRRCEQCQENYYYEASTFHCQLCPTCYHLVQLEVERLKFRMTELDKELRVFSHDPQQLYQLYTNHLQSSLQDMEAQTMQGSGAHFVGLVAEIEMSLARIGQELSNISHRLDCEGSEHKRCIVVAASESIVHSTRTQLQTARVTLNSTIPLLIHSSLAEEGRNWTGLVKKSRSLAGSQFRVAMEVESIAREALATSNRSYILLSGIIADDSIAAGITDAEDGLQSLQSQMEELVEEVDEVLKEAKRASAEQSRGANFTLPRNLTELEPEGWNSFIAETENLESALQAAEQQIEKLLLELEPRVKAFMMGMETKETFDELLRRVKFSEASARESIQKVRRIKEDGLSLLKTLEDNKRLFPAGKVRSQGTWRKMSAVKERVMVEAKRKTSLARRALRVAESSSTISNTTATRAWHLSRGVAKDAQKTRSRAQDQAAQSGLLRTQLGTMQDQLVAQEHQAAAFKVKFQEDSKTSAKVLHETEAMGKKVTKAKQSLDRDLKQLTKLLKTVESLQVDQVTEEMLNKTEVEMGALRWVIDQKLDQKLRELEAASDLQILKMKAIEKDMEDIEAEKLSLEDIVQNLPQGCYNRVGL